MPRVISIGSTVSMVDFTDYYDRTVGAITIDDNFDKTTRSVSCRFALVNPPSVPTPYQIVEIYYPDQETGSGSNTIFSGIIKSITKRIAAYHPVNANTAVYDIVAESWEVRGSDFELINYAEFYSQKFGYIVKSIIDNYLPHLDSSSLSGTEGPTLERVIFVNRRPNEAITQLCEKSGYYWYVTPDRKVYINYIGGTNFSPLVIADNSIQHRKIDLQLVDNIDSKINDLFLRIASIKGAFTQQQIPLDGFTGNYPLRAKPYGLADVVPIVDEFNGGDTPTYPDEGKWNVEDDEQLLYLQDGRLQISKGSTPGMITSRSLIGTSNTIYARNLETEIISIDAGGYLCMGLHTGEASTDVSKILLGIQIEPNVDPTKGDIKIRKGATLSSVVYTMDFNVGDPKPYQFRILVQGGVYYIQVQDPDDLASGKPSYTQIDSDVISLPDYVSYCPALTSSDVEATVIQGAVILKPEFYAWLAEEQNITSVGEKDTVYITCEHANWSKWLLKGTLVYFYDRDGVEYSVNPISGLPFMIEGNNTQQIFVFSTPPVSWFTTNNIQALRIAQRPLIISNSSANDYEIHAFIEEIQGTPMFRFFAGEIPCGQLYVEYWTDQPKTLRVYDEVSINYFLSISGIPSDTGHRKEFLDVSKSVTTLNELLEYAKTYLQSNLHSFVEGTIETDTNLIGTSARIRSGMNQSISGLTIGEEYISTTDSYISRVSMTDVGGNQFKYTISLGDLQDYIHSLFITKLNVLHQEELFIDDLGNNERLEYDDIVEIGDIDNRLDSPYFTSYYFGSDGIYLAWSTVSGAAQYELRLDDSKGTQGTGFLYRGTNTTYSITGSDVKRRKYRFYIYSIDASGNYSKLPYVVTVENKQPTTTPLRDILVSNEGVITVVFRMPFETDVNKRVVYVNNQAVADDDLASSDIIFELAPWEPSVEFMSYDTTLYVSVVEQDPWYALDTKPIRFDRIIATNIITKPPEEPVGWEIQTQADDETLQTSQIRLRFPYLIDPSYGRPKVFHVQFKEDGVFPDPNDGLPNGTDEAILEVANSSTVKLPLGALSGMGSLIPTDYLMVLHTTFPTIDGSYVKDWYVGRFILDVTDDGVNDIVTVSGEFPIDAADDYDWQIWSKWYNDCDLFREYPVSRDTYIFAAEYYEFIDELNDWSGYARVYAVNDFGLIGPVDFGSLITTSPIGTSDPDVPTPPRNICAYANGYTIHISWDAPSSNINTLDHYTAAVSTSQYAEDGGDYSLVNYVSVEVPAGQRTADIIVYAVGNYAVGVTATNSIGTSDWAILEQEA